MKQFRYILFFHVLLMFNICLFADKDVEPEAYIKTTEDGKHYFKMVPMGKGNGEGILFKVNSAYPIAQNADSIIWKTTGWYSRFVYLSDDIKYLVRIGDWPRGKKTKDTDLAIAFYNNGILVKSYSTKDLIKFPKAMPLTVSHYTFLREIIGFESSQNFSIVTSDNIEYKFDVTNGKILAQKSL